MSSAPFVGREVEVEQLTARIDEAGQGRGSVVLVRGPAGVGKTRLVDEVVSARRVPVGRGYAAPEGAPPLWCWTQACAAAGLDAAGLELRRDTTAGGAADEAAAARFRWLAEIADLMVSAAGPVVLVLEDVHWSDHVSLELLRAVASTVAGSCLVVVATTRPADPDREAQYGLLERFGSVATIDVTPLSVAAVAELVGGEAGRAARVHAETHGLPLLITAGVTAGRFDVRRIALALLAQVDPEVREDAEVAAVLGEQVDRDLLAAVLEREPRLDELVRGGLLVAESRRFIHALVRDAIAETVPAPQVTEAHRRAAAHLAQTPGVPASRVVAHLTAAGDDHAAEWARRAADEALAAHAYDDAVRYLRMVEEAQVRCGTPAPQVASTRLDIADAAYLAGRPTEALARCREVSAGMDDPVLLAQAALVVREVAFPEADQTNSALARRALAVDQPEATRSRLLAQLATAHSNGGQMATAATTARQAWDCAVRSGDPEAMVAAAQAREATMNCPEDDHERLAIAVTAAANAEQLGRPVAQSLALGWQTRAAYGLADLGAAAESVESLTSLTARTRIPLLELRLARTVAAVASLEGHFAQAQASNEEARRLALAAGDPIAAMLAEALDIHLGFLRGRLDDLRGDAFIDAPRSASPIVIGKRALLRVAWGDESAARADFLRLRPLLFGTGDDLMYGAVFGDLVELVEHFRDGEAAVALVARLEPWLTLPGVVGIPMAYFCAPVSAYLGRCLTVAARPAEAVPHLRRAVEVAAALGARPHAAAARRDLAVALLASGGPGSTSEARSLLDGVAAEARDLDMTGVAAGAARLMPDGDGVLSPREREITALVLDALSNRAIAGRLVISERTVETHVRSVLGKLGCANRAELIARRVELGL